MSELEQVLMQRDNLTQEQAREWVQDARARVQKGHDPEELLYEEFGLEPDYVFDLL